MSHTYVMRAFRRWLAQAHQLNVASSVSPLQRQNAAQVKSTVRRGPRLSRRYFVRHALAGSAAIALGAQLRVGGIHPVLAADQPQPIIAIIGGGMAGLNAAYQLQQAGFSATVYEARSRLGGRIHSLTGVVGNDLVLEMGAAFINSDHDDLLALVDAFDLELFDRNADAASRPMPTNAYVGDGTLRSEAEVATALQAIAAQIAVDSALLDEDWDTYAPIFDALSVADYLAQYADLFPESWVRTLIETTIRTEYGVEPAESSALQLIFLLPTVEGDSPELLSQSDERFEVIGGNSRLIDGLAMALEGQIKLRHELLSVDAQESQTILHFRGGLDVRADYVIFALPFAVLRHVELNIDLPDELAAMIQEVGSGRNEKVHAGFSHRIWQKEGLFSQAIWMGEGFTEAWDATARQQELPHAALTFYLGGDEVPAHPRQRAAVQGDTLIEMLDAVLPGAAEAANGRILRTAWTRSRFTRGGYSTFAPGQYTRFGHYLYIDAEDPEERQEVFAGNIAFAGEHLSDSFYGYMNGAAQTGRMAAEVIMRLISEAAA